jgi:predicted acetyltransferase
MAMDESVSLRPGTPADLDAISDLLDYVFHHRTADEDREVDDPVIEPERSLVAEDAGAVVGHTTALSRELTVPGAIVPAAHVTGVGVAPTHRRRGLLTAMMRRQLTEVAAAGREPIAVLWASETSIYPRFGYGPAAARLQLDVMTREVRVAEPAPSPGRLRLLDPQKSIAELAAVYERLRPAKVGWSTRDERWWRVVLSDTEARRGGATPLRGVLHEGPDGPTGYALWRVHDRWDEYGPDARVRIREVAAGDPGTYAALWRFLLGIDLARTATYEYAAVDDPLQYLVDEPRRLGRTLSDALWVRLINLPAALEARRYPAPVDVVLEVDDPLLEQNAGRWRLTGGPGKASCARTDAPPDLACSVTELGAAYLGATSLAALAAAGRVRQLTDDLPSVAFGWHRLPQPTEVF